MSRCLEPLMHIYMSAACRGLSVLYQSTSRELRRLLSIARSPVRMMLLLACQLTHCLHNKRRIPLEPVLRLGLLSAPLPQVYTHFAEALDGLVTIRAFDDQPRFTAKNEALVAATQRASIAGVATAQWLALRLQLMTAVIVFLIALLAVLDAEDVLPSAAPGRPVNIGTDLCASLSTDVHIVHIDMLLFCIPCSTQWSCTLLPNVCHCAPGICGSYCAASR